MEGATVTKVYPYHTTEPETPERYHDHDNCPTGQQILPQNRAPGDGGRARCYQCRDLD